MELRWRNKATGDVGIAFVMDSDAEVLRAMGYEHFYDEDVYNNIHLNYKEHLYKNLNIFS